MMLRAAPRLLSYTQSIALQTRPHAGNAPAPTVTIGLVPVPLRAEIGRLKVRGGGPLRGRPDAAGIARIAGASLGTVRKWEHGERSPSGAVRVLARIWRATGAGDRGGGARGGNAGARGGEAG